MDPRTMPGFLDTGAPLLQDLTVVGYIIFMIPAMLIGFSFARRHLFVPHHKYVMTGITLLNWAIIIYLMLVSYRENVAHNVPQGLNQAVYLLPTVHLITGALAQIIATVLVIRMWFERSLPRALRFEPIKPWMRLTLALWLITAILGIGIYVTWYIIKPWPATTTPSGDVPAITATEDATPDSNVVATPEATEDATTELGGATAATPEATEDAVVPEGIPQATPES